MKSSTDGSDDSISKIELKDYTFFVVYQKVVRFFYKKVIKKKVVPSSSKS